MIVGGKLRGRGLSCYIEVCATISDRMELRFDATGGLTILAGTFSYGQGHHTSYAQMVHEWLGKAPRDELELRRREAELLFRRIGITFAVYTEGGDPERLIPFDIVPRVLARAEWTRLAKGLEQRVRALNAFLHDVYHAQEILRAGRIPEAIVLAS